MNLLNVGLVILLGLALQIDGQRVDGDTEITKLYNNNTNIANSTTDFPFNITFDVEAKEQKGKQNGTIQVTTISGLNKVVEAFLNSSDAVNNITLAQFKNITLSGLCFGVSVDDSVECSFILEYTYYKGQQVVDGNVVTGELLFVQGPEFPKKFPKVPGINATADEAQDGVLQTVGLELQFAFFGIIPGVADAISNSFKTYFATQS